LAYLVMMQMNMFAI